MIPFFRRWILLVNILIKFLNLKIISLIEITRYIFFKSYGFGDPHIRTFKGHEFSLPNLCSYVVATDACLGFLKTYSVTVDLENRFNNLAAIYIKRVNIELSTGENITIGKDLIVNNQPQSLPYITAIVSATKQFNYIVVKAGKVIVKFDGVQYLKVLECGARVCGLCGSKNDTEIIVIENFSLGNC